MMLKPAGHRVLVKPDPIEEVTPGGIVIAREGGGKREQDAQIRGTLVEVGPTAWKAFDSGEPWAKVGDKVWFAKYGGYLINDGEEQLRILNDEDICAVEHD